MATHLAFTRAHVLPAPSAAVEESGQKLQPMRLFSLSPSGPFTVQWSAGGVKGFSVILLQQAAHVHSTNQHHRCLLLDDFYLHEISDRQFFYLVPFVFARKIPRSLREVDTSVHPICLLHAYFDRK